MAIMINDSSRHAAAAAGRALSLGLEDAWIELREEFG
jgi:hypothetical protein